MCTAVVSDQTTIVRCRRLASEITESACAAEVACGVSATVGVRALVGSTFVRALGAHEDESLCETLIAGLERFSSYEVLVECTFLLMQNAVEDEVQNDNLLEVLGGALSHPNACFPDEQAAKVALFLLEMLERTLLEAKGVANQDLGAGRIPCSH
jgi:hypothetical protein